MTSEERMWSIEEPGLYGAALDIGIRPDGTGWATLYDGDQNWRHDIQLSDEDVRRLREVVEEVPDELPEQHVPRVGSE